jgi:hypothetical protein
MDQARIDKMEAHMEKAEREHKKMGKAIVNCWYNVLKTLKADSIEAAFYISLSIAAKTLLYGKYGEYKVLVSQIEQLKSENAVLRIARQFDQISVCKCVEKEMQV